MHTDFPKRAFEQTGEPLKGERLALELDDMESVASRPSSIPPEAATESDGWSRLRLESEPPPSRPQSITPSPLERNEALQLVSKRPKATGSPGVNLVAEMTDRFELGDYTGALRVAELVLGRNPAHPGAVRCAEQSRERLLHLYSARLASMCDLSSEDVSAQMPVVAVPDHEVRWLGLDHRQGFVLSRLDGEATVEDVIDLTGMTRLEVLRTLVELVEAGVVRMR